MTNPSDDMRRLLTEYIGLCWHEFNEYGDCVCGLKWHQKHSQRSFTLPADLHAVYGAMVKNGDWADYCKEVFMEWFKLPFHKQVDFAAWISCYHDPSQIGERMEMVGDFIKKVVLK